MTKVRRLVARKLPDTITRRRPGPSQQDEYGRRIEPVYTETELRANVQPVVLEDEDQEDGIQLQDRLRVYVPGPDSLLAARLDAEADRVVWEGADYVVHSTQKWPRAHTRAILLRES